MAVKIIKNDHLWIEGEAIDHLQRLSLLEGVDDVVGLPDIHQGKVPVGTTIKISSMVYPFLIGNDIGCGMALFNTNVKIKKLNLKNIIKRLENTQIIGKYSIGSGNHFAEMQMLDKIYDKEIANSMKLDKKFLYLLVHSGSRNLGEKIYRQYASKNPLLKDSQEMKEYMDKHDHAIKFAKINRVKIADILMEKVGLKFHNELIVDCIHNYIEIIDGVFYHHKGSISAYDQYAVIAGSRGNYSYVVKCIPRKETLYSISHGAGRKWPRYLCKARLENKYKSQDDLYRTKIGGRVILNKKELLYEEASEAYKSIEDVIDVLLEYECIELIARLKPLVTYKC